MVILTMLPITEAEYSANTRCGKNSCLLLFYPILISKNAHVANTYAILGLSLASIASILTMSAAILPAYTKLLQSETCKEVGWCVCKVGKIC